MSNPPRRVYKFDDFELDPDGPALYHRGEMIDQGGRKMLQVLAVYLRHPRDLVSHQAVLDEVWGEDTFGVTPEMVSQYISQLRTVFSRFEPGKDYFKSKRGRGYIFEAEVEVSGDEPPPADDLAEQPAEQKPGHPPLKQPTNTRRRGVNKVVLGAVGMVVVALSIFAYWQRSQRNDDEEVRRIVNESQLYESLILYRDPNAFKESDLDKYWTPELQTNVNYDRSRIRGAVKKLIEEGQHYGEESRCEVFEFQTVEIDKKNATAVVKTLEKWFVAIYQTDGTLLKNRTIGPYFVSYIVRNIDDRWLIEKSTTGRIIRPTPHLSEVEPITPAIAGKEFWVRVKGQDLEAETVYFEIVGPGCPQIKPCKVPNDVLRDKSRMTDSAIDNIPLTLASGSFNIIAHNGDSPPSEPVTLKVP